MSRLTRAGPAEPISRDQILRHARGQGDIIFRLQLTTSRIGNLTRLIHTLYVFVVVVVVVDSHIQLIVLATMKTTVTQRVSHRPINKCQSRSWSQRGTKVNGSHRGDTPLLRLTGIFDPNRDVKIETGVYL